MFLVSCCPCTGILAAHEPFNNRSSVVSIVYVVFFLPVIHFGVYDWFILKWDQFIKKIGQNIFIWFQDKEKFYKICPLCYFSTLAIVIFFPYRNIYCSKRCSGESRWKYFLLFMLQLVWNEPHLYWEQLPFRFLYLCSS